MNNFKNKTSNGAGKRIFLSIIILSAVFYMPWWVVAPLAFVGAFLYHPYYEIFLFGVLVDILYGASAFPLGGAYGIIGATVIFFTASYVKKAVR